MMDGKTHSTRCKKNKDAFLILQFYSSSSFSIVIFDLFPILAVPVQEMTLTDNYESPLSQSLTAISLRCIEVQLQV